MTRRASSSPLSTPTCSPRPATPRLPPTPSTPPSRSTFPSVELQREGHVLNVTVGEVEHPMEDAHYIEWIALEAAGRLEIHYLKPGQAPTTFFAGGVKTGIVYAYCNLHGLWKAEF